MSLEGVQSSGSGCGAQADSHPAGMQSFHLYLLCRCLRSFQKDAFTMKKPGADLSEEVSTPSELAQTSFAGLPTTQFVVFPSLPQDVTHEASRLRLSIEREGVFQEKQILRCLSRLGKVSRQALVLKGANLPEDICHVMAPVPAKSFQCAS